MKGGRIDLQKLARLHSASYHAAESSANHSDPPQSIHLAER
jgi:hypothetical protein